MVRRRLRSSGDTFGGDHDAVAGGGDREVLQLAGVFGQFAVEAGEGGGGELFAGEVAQELLHAHFDLLRFVGNLQAVVEFFFREIAEAGEHLAFADAGTGCDEHFEQFSPGADVDTWSGSTVTGACSQMGSGRNRMARAALPSAADENAMRRRFMEALPRD